MAKKIEFKNCLECPFGKNSYIGTWVACEIVGGTHRGLRTYRLVQEPHTKPKECPFKKGILIEKCENCPYVSKIYGELACPKIKHRMSIPVKGNKIHKDCPLKEVE